jgi:hypothetical protein
MKKLISMLLFLPLMASCATPGKAELDAEVRRLCAIDGGIKVYETVRLPAEKFNQWEQPNFYQPTQGENTLGAEYIFKEEQHYYRRGNPEMSRHHYQVFRRLDGKLLGETVFYGRGGGDMPGPWHESSFVCPDYKDADSMALLMKVFVRLQHERNEK